VEEWFARLLTWHHERGITNVQYVVSADLFWAFETAKVCSNSNKKIQIQAKIQLFD
jgi:hypothetical protein